MIMVALPCFICHTSATRYGSSILLPDVMTLAYKTTGTNHRKQKY